MDPVKALAKTGMLGNLLNHFDGGVEVLDDLDDHWTAKNHKQERSIIIEDLQDLAADKSVRITILRYVGSAPVVFFCSVWVLLLTELQRRCPSCSGGAVLL